MRNLASSYNLRATQYLQDLNEIKSASINQGREETKEGTEETADESAVEETVEEEVHFETPSHNREPSVDWNHPFEYLNILIDRYKLDFCTLVKENTDAATVEKDTCKNYTENGNFVPEKVPQSSYKDVFEAPSNYKEAWEHECPFQREQWREAIRNEL
jgi:hypothetical protein